MAVRLRGVERTFFALEKQMIARQNGFDLEGKETAKRRKLKKDRMNVRFFAITCWTNASSEESLVARDCTPSLSLA